MANALIEVQQHGQSLWYDTIRRDLMASGELQHLIDHDGLRGITSNPAIFEKAITGSTDYDTRWIPCNANRIWMPRACMSAWRLLTFKPRRTY